MSLVPLSKSGRARFALRRLHRDESGVAAIEFAIVALPFLLFTLGLIGLGLYFLASTSLEYGVEKASRKLLTGEAKKESMTAGQFRQNVCLASGTYIDCSKLSVLVQSANNWDGLAPQPCLDEDNKLAASTGADEELISKYSGGAEKVVMVTLCYAWELANTFQFLGLGIEDDGSGPAIIQAAAAFKSEPYE